MKTQILEDIDYVTSLTLSINEKDYNEERTDEAYRDIHNYLANLSVDPFSNDYENIADMSSKVNNISFMCESFLYELGEYKGDSYGAIEGLRGLFASIISEITGVK